MSKVLLVENNLSLQKSLKDILKQSGHQVMTATSLDKSFSLLDKYYFSLAVIDRGLDDGDRLEIVDYLNDSSFSTRTIVLTQLSGTEEKIRGLRSGADDYMPKPFSTQELKLRIDNLLNKSKVKQESVMSFGSIKFYENQGVVECENKRVQLRPKAAALLKCFLVHKNQVISRERIIDYVWGSKIDVPLTSSLDVYIRRLRIKLKGIGLQVKTVRGFGYSLVY